MPPPPSQKGKFKPRKPKRIVQPGESSAGDGTAGNAGGASSSSPSVAFDPTTSGGGHGGAGDGSSNRYGSRGSVGRGGRGGRGRGGRGRSPAPQGRVFFTGGDRKAGVTPSSSGSSSTMRKPSTMDGAARRTTKDGDSGGVTGSSRDAGESTEEVVGQLDTAIGSGHAKDKKEPTVLGGNSNKMDYDDDEVGGFEGGRGPTDFSLPGSMYDSDSSDEGSKARRGHTAGLMPPLELPFPTKLFPIGIGSSKRPAGYHVPDQTRAAIVTNDSNLSSSALQESKSSWTSPFVHVHEGKASLEESNSWFLVQLPTRLPPLKQNNSASSKSNTIGEADEEVDAMLAEAPRSSDAATTSIFSEVITPPVMASNFDNTLETVAPGQIGRILVYKSGRTVLVMDGPDGTEVRNGCRFLSHAPSHFIVHSDSPA